jgi:hypothetical protein
MIILYGVYFQGERGSREHFKGAYEFLSKAQLEAKNFGFHGIDGIIVKFVSDGMVMLNDY